MLQQIDSRIVSAKRWMAAALAQSGKIKDAELALSQFLEGMQKDARKPLKKTRDWRGSWARETHGYTEQQFDHLREGLRKAGLSI